MNIYNVLQIVVLLSQVVALILFGLDMGTPFTQLWAIAGGIPIMFLGILATSRR